jgi:hypothetical protein
LVKTRLPLRELLQIDLTDPEFHALLLAQSATMHKHTKELLDSAVSLRQLQSCDTAALARLVQQVNEGSMLTWAVFREGAPAAWIRRSLNNLLHPYRVRSGPRIKQRTR